MVEEKKYNILVVHNHYQKAGGEDTVVNNEIEMLREHGHNVYTYFRDNTEINKYNILQKVFLSFNYIFNFKTYRNIRKIIKEKKIDIVHVHNTLSLISQSVYYATDSMHTPIVQTVHNFRFLCPNALFYRDGHICEDCVSHGLICSIKHKCYRNSRLQSIIQDIYMLIMRHTGILKKINFIVLTEFNKEKLLYLNKIYKHKLIDENKVFVKPNFVKQTITESEIVPAKDRKYYLFVGRLDEIKGIDIVLEAFSRMPDKELHVVGSGGEKYVEQYKNYKNIKFLGFINHDKIYDEYKYAINLIFASKWYEGLPTNIIEAYSTGTPVISSNVGNGASLVEDGETGFLFENNDKSDLCNKIKLNQKNIELLCYNAYSKYKNEYSEYQNYKKIIDIYSNIIK